MRGVDFGLLVNPRPFAEHRVARIFDVVGQLAADLVQPNISDHAMDGRVRPGGKRRMADDGFRVGMAVVAVAIDGAAIEEVAKAPFAEAIVVA